MVRGCPTAVRDEKQESENGHNTSPLNLICVTEGLMCSNSILPSANGLTDCRLCLRLPALLLRVASRCYCFHLNNEWHWWWSQAETWQRPVCHTKPLFFLRLTLSILLCLSDFGLCLICVYFFCSCPRAFKANVKGRLCLISWCVCQWHRTGSCSERCS